MDKFENTNKEMDCFVTMKRWLENRNKNHTFVDYFNASGYKTVAIYGAGDLGKLLYEEIKDSNIKVSYFVDRNGEGLKNVDGIPVVMLKDVVNQEQVDVMVVTPAGNFEAISRDIVKNVPQMCLVSLKDAVYEF